MILAHKRVVITGGSRGLGRALVETFAREGARVGFTYTSNAGAADALVEALGGQGHDVRAFRASVLDAEGTRAMAGALNEAWGGVDVLVNNAGVNQNLPLALLDAEDWTRVMEVNVKGAFLTTQAFAPGMIRRRSGAILMIGSVAGVRILEGPPHYCASKAALVGLTGALAKELGRKGVRVNCLAPGLLSDGLGQTLPDHRVEGYLRHCALGRLGTPAEVARFAAFLVSDANGYMSGETVLMDGGI